MRYLTNGAPLSKSFRILALFFSIIVTKGCTTFHKETSRSLHQPSTAIELLLDSAFETDIKLQAFEPVVSFYKARGYQVIWSDSARTIPVADTLINFIHSAQYLGLIPEEYHAVEIKEIVKRRMDAVKASRLDLLLTDAFFSLHHHLKNGRLKIDSLNNMHFNAPVNDTAGVYALHRILKNNHITREFARQEPAHHGYRALKRILANILDEKLQTKRLVSSSENIFYDREAIIRRININLERWRWDIEQYPDRYLMVNIPAYSLHVFEGEKSVFTSKVVVGSPNRQTPVLSSVIRNFLIYPYWTVPRSIATKELLPHIKRDTLYLQTHDYEVLDPLGNVMDAAQIDWQQYHLNKFPFQIRQREGTANALGIIKFVFNNPYGVYLHDTNAKGFFRRQMRALSHGCVRVEKATELGKYLIREDSLYITPDDLEQYLQLKQQRVIRVPKPIPVFLRYFTVEANDSALLEYDDIYQKDAALTEAFTRYSRP